MSPVRAGYFVRFVLYVGSWSYDYRLLKDYRRPALFPHHNAHNQAMHSPPATTVWKWKRLLISSCHDIADSSEIYIKSLGVIDPKIRKIPPVCSP